MTSRDRLLAAAHGSTPDRIPVAPYLGNLDPVECLWRGTPAEVATAARDAIVAAGRRAFILGSGCEVPVLAPRENLFAMVAAARP